MFALVKRLRDDQSGATAIEYGLIALIVGVGIIPALQLIAPELNATFLFVASIF
ncbi:MAG: Flp family type IVb pilin [Pseudomonadota bacterium]